MVFKLFIVILLIFVISFSLKVCLKEKFSTFPSLVEVISQENSQSGECGCYKLDFEQFLDIITNTDDKKALVNETILNFYKNQVLNGDSYTKQERKKIGHFIKNIKNIKSV